jgi:DNA-binding transcriptional regulator YdaS (Cro superfamily)
MDSDTKKAIREFLLKNRGSQGELAAMLGVSETFLSQWARGRSASARLDREIPACMDELNRRMLQKRIPKLQKLACAVIAVIVGVVPYGVA